MNVLFLVLMALLDWSYFKTEPFDKQKAFLQDCSDTSIQYVSTFCGLQAGKTLAECDGARAALYLSENPLVLPKGMSGSIPAEVWLVSKNYPLAETLLETFKWRNEDLFMSDRQLKGFGLTRGDRFTHYLIPRTAVHPTCKDNLPVKLRVRTQSDPESLRAANTVILIVGDEFAWWKEKSAQNAQGRGIVTKTKFIIGTTPHGKNHAYRTFALPGGYGGGKRDPKYATHSWRSADNPHADKEYIARLEKILGKAYAMQELEGLFTDAIGYVFPTFDRMKHMGSPPSEDPKDYVKITGGIDPGFTDPYAASIWGKTKDGVWWQLWEMYRTQQTSVDIAPTIFTAQERWEVPRWYGDKRRPSDLKDLRRNGVRVVPNIDIYGETDRSTIKPMLSVIQGLMERDKIMIRTDHEATANEFERYHYDTDEDKEKNTNDIPVDIYNHLADCARYGICAIEDLSHAGPRYRRGTSMKPQEVVSRGPKVLIPTLAQSMAFQDEKLDSKWDRENSAKRRSAVHFLRQRSKFRKELT